MELKTWLKSESGRTARLEEYLTEVVRKVNPKKVIASAQIWRWTRDDDDDRKQPIPSYLAQSIETFTKGQVMRWDCCPNDWFLLWPELMTHRDSPPIKAQAAAEVELTKA